MALPLSRNDVVTVNSAAIASEVFDEETVVINFEKGTYFSMRGSASAIWSLLKAPTSIAAIMHELQPQQKAHADFEATLTQFIDQLLDQDLLIRSVDTPVRPHLPNHLMDKLAHPPNLEVYSDLAELIAMDPVHEIDTFSGWPHRPPPES
jgi:hypothetical protein